MSQVLDGIKTGPFFTRRSRRYLYPWLPRADRRGSIPGLNHGNVDPRLLPLEDGERWDWVVFHAFFDYPAPYDGYVAGPLVRAGSSVRYVLAKTFDDTFRDDLSGWRLYFTPTAPAALGDLLDSYEVYPVQRRSDGTPVPSLRWGPGWWSRISPTDRPRNFPGYYSVRWTDPTGILNSANFRVIITQPIPQL